MKKEEVILKFTSIQSNIANSRTLKAFKILISITFVLLILDNIDINDTFHVIKNLDLYYSSSAMALTFLVSLLFVLRIYILFENKLKNSFIGLYLINRAGNMFNFFLFGNVGQELARVMYIKDVNKKEILYISLFDRLLGLLSVMVILFFGVTFYNQIGNISTSAIRALIVVLLISLIIIILYLMRYLKLNQSTFLKSIGISLLYNIGLVCIAALSFRAVGVTGIFLDLFWVIPVLSILLMLPLSINGIGLREYFLLYILGLSKELIVSYAVLNYCIYIILCIPGLIYFLSSKSRKTSEEYT